MNRATARAELARVLQGVRETGLFVELVTDAIARVYADSEFECPEGFGALEAAAEFFREAES